MKKELKTLLNFIHFINSYQFCSHLFRKLFWSLPFHISILIENLKKFHRLSFPMIKFYLPYNPFISNILVISLIKTVGYCESTSSITIRLLLFSKYYRYEFPGTHNFI